jgi:hypothetical protein
MPATPFNFVFGLEIRQRAVDRHRKLRPAEGRLACERGVRVQHRLGRSPVIVVVGGDVEPTPGDEGLRQRVGVDALEETPLVMALLRPRVGVEDVVRRNRSLGDRASHQIVRRRARRAFPRCEGTRSTIRPPSEIPRGAPARSRAGTVPCRSRFRPRRAPRGRKRDASRGRRSPSSRRGGGGIPKQP